MPVDGATAATCPVLHAAVAAPAPAWGTGHAAEMAPEWGGSRAGGRGDRAAAVVAGQAAKGWLGLHWPLFALQPLTAMSTGGQEPWTIWLATPWPSSPISSEIRERGSTGVCLTLLLYTIPTEGNGSLSINFLNLWIEPWGTWSQAT